MIDSRTKNPKAMTVLLRGLGGGYLISSCDSPSRLSKSFFDSACFFEASPKREVELPSFISCPGPYRRDCPSQLGSTDMIIVAGVMISRSSTKTMQQKASNVTNLAHAVSKNDDICCPGNLTNQSNSTQFMLTTDKKNKRSERYDRE
jgi:hypothetical protein